MRFGLGVGSTYSGTAGAWSSSLLLSATGATSVVGTNGATFYITGVQLEVGSSATGFEYRQYQQELALCQRYFCKLFDIATAPADGVGAGVNTAVAAYSTANSWSAWIPFPVTMRTNPTITGYRATGLGVSNGLWAYYIGGWTSFTTQAYGVNTTGFYVGGNSASVFATGGAYISGGHFTAAAEL